MDIYIIDTNKHIFIHKYTHLSFIHIHTHIVTHKQRCCCLGACKGERKSNINTESLFLIVPCCLLLL